MKRLSMLMFYVLAGAMLVCAAHATEPVEHSRPPSGSECAALGTLALPNTAIVRAEDVPAGMFSAPGGKSYRVKGFCRVQAVSRPTPDSEIHFEVWLPASGWNGRYYQHGEGGGGGAINYTALAAFLDDGVAVGATDNGHVKDADGSYRWGQGHPEKIIDFTYRALQVTRDNAQHLIEHRYGRPAQRYYFAGCSGGGAEAMMAAQRFADRWDGILAGAPDQDAIGFHVNSAWQAHRWLMHPEGRIAPEQLPLIQRAAVASCGSDAHVDNDIAADPRQCRFDPRVLLCQRAGDKECLTAAQVETLRQLYDGPPKYRPTNKVIYHGFPATLESGWATFITGYGKFPTAPVYEAGEPASVHFGTKLFRGFVFEDSNWDLRSFQLERDFARALNKKIVKQPLSRVLNADATDLSALRDRGSKLLLYTGWGDPAISALNIIAYYEDVARAMGGMQDIQGFFRLFAVPGMGHCAGGPGATAFGQHPSPSSTALKNDDDHNVRRALESWVEQGKAPDGLIAAKYVDGDSTKGAAYTRPVCSYPGVPIYKGSGSRDMAENFACVVRK